MPNYADHDEVSTCAKKGREQTMLFALWAERLPPQLLTIETIRARWKVSRATAYRWLTDFLKAHRAMWPA